MKMSSFLLFFLVMEHRWHEIDRGKPKYSVKILSQCHFVHHKSHMSWPGIEPGPPRWEATRLAAWAMARPLLFKLRLSSRYFDKMWNLKIVCCCYGLFQHQFSSRYILHDTFGVPTPRNDVYCAFVWKTFLDNIEWIWSLYCMKCNNSKYKLNYHFVVFRASQKWFNNFTCC